MSGDRLPPSVVALLQSRLDSFEKLEVMRRLSIAAQPVEHDALLAALQIDRDSLRTVLHDLEEIGFIEQTASGPSRIELGPDARGNADFQTLMRLYEEDRIAVIAALSSISVARIRGMTARRFADAFVIRPRRKRPADE